MTNLSLTCIGCVVFDLDGTLYPLDEFPVDYAALLRDALHALTSRTCEECEELIRCFHVCDESVRPSVTAVVESAGVPIPAWNDYRDSRLGGRMSIRPNPAITSSIKAVAARVPVALVTNSTAKLARECLASLGLRDGDFTAFIAADAGFAPKPSSAPFLEVARLVDCDPGTLFGIGDRWTTDVAPLVRLGGRGVCISNPTDVVGVCADIAEFLRSDKPPLPLSRE